MSKLKVPGEKKGKLFLVLIIIIIILIIYMLYTRPELWQQIKGLIG